MTSKQSAGVSRTEAKNLLDEIRGSKERLDFEDGVGDGWIKHSKGKQWSVRMSFGHVATIDESTLLDEIEEEAESVTIRREATDSES